MISGESHCHRPNLPPPRPPGPPPCAATAASGLRVWARRLPSAKPAPPTVFRAFGRMRRALPGSQIEPLQRSFLRLRVDDVGIVGIDARPGNHRLLRR